MGTRGKVTGNVQWLGQLNARLPGEGGIAGGDSLPGWGDEGNGSQGRLKSCPFQNHFIPHFQFIEPTTFAAHCTGGSEGC